MIGLIQFLIFSSYAQQNIKKLDIGTLFLNSPKDIVKITSNHKNVFLIGKFDSYPIFELNTKDNTWITNCEFCDMEDWDLSEPELIILSENWNNSTLFVSGLYVSESEVESKDFKILVEEIEFPYCPSECSFRGKCGRVCECELGFVGYSCTTPAGFLRMGSKEKGEMPGYSWSFFVTKLEKSENSIHIEFEKICSLGLHIYLSPSNNTENFPSVNSYRSRITFPEKDDMLARYFINENYVLWSFFCSQKENCSFSVELKSRHSEKKRMFVRIFAMSTALVIASILAAFLILKVFKRLKNKYKPLDCERIITKNDMEACFPKYIKYSDEFFSKVCCICLADLDKNGSMRTLGCIHSFHAKCIDQWTAEHMDCPLCKQKLFLSHGLLTTRNK